MEAVHTFAAPTAPPGALSLLVDWRPDYVMLVVAAAVGLGYYRTRRAASVKGIAWARHRDVTFWLGLFAIVWTTNGFAQARSFQLMWVWMMQELLLLLIVPFIVMSAQPLSLVAAVYGPDNAVSRLLRTKILRFFGSPMVSPVLVPILSVLLVFGGLGDFAVSSVLAGGLVHLLLLFAGALVALPLVNMDDRRTSLAVGLSLGVGFVELIMDAFPGVALRFQTHLTLMHFAENRPAFSPNPIDDQHIAGGMLWIVAELVDLPFLILAARSWIRADARDAATVDAELDAKAARAADEQTLEESPADRPWWLDDPDLPDRFRRPAHQERP